MKPELSQKWSYWPENLTELRYYIPKLIQMYFIKIRHIDVTWRHMTCFTKKWFSRLTSASMTSWIINELAKKSLKFLKFHHIRYYWSRIYSPKRMLSSINSPLRNPSIFPIFDGKSMTSLWKSADVGLILTPSWIFFHNMIVHMLEKTHAHQGD